MKIEIRRDYSKETNNQNSYFVQTKNYKLRINKLFLCPTIIFNLKNSKFARIKAA